MKLAFCFGLLITFFIHHLPVLGQLIAPLAKNKQSSNLNSLSVFEVIKIEGKATKANSIPLFGGIEMLEIAQKQNSAFLKMCSKNFPNIKEASKFFADRAWEYLGEGELDTAIHRFNLSFLLNPKNTEPYWGLGVICFKKGEYDNASRILTMGMALNDNNSALITDLATVEIACFEKNNHFDDLQKAQFHLKKALKANKSNADAFFKMSKVEYLLNNYDKAWKNIHLARQIDVSKIELDFIKNLTAKMKDPKGLF